MEDHTDTAQAPPKQSFIEQQLGAAITPAAEREKLNRSFDAFCEELDAQGEASPEPIKAPAEPAAVEAAPVKQPVTQIALQPTPPRDPDPLDQQARQMEIGAYITRHPSYKQEKLATQAAYEECIQEMSRHYDAPAEKVREEFLDPLLKSFTPDQLTDEWFSQQVELMNAPSITKRKIEAKWAQVQELQARQNKKAQELAANYDADQQQRAAQNWQAVIMAEATTQIDEEREFSAIKNIRDRANTGDPKASAQFNDLEQNVFRPYMVKLLTEHPNTPPGTATRKALKHVANHLQGKGQKKWHLLRLSLRLAKVVHPKSRCLKMLGPAWMLLLTSGRRPQRRTTTGTRRRTVTNAGCVKVPSWQKLRVATSSRSRSGYWGSI